jgi:hypothetical protein
MKSRRPSHLPPVAPVRQLGKSAPGFRSPQSVSRAAVAAPSPERPIDANLALALRFA